MGTLKTQGRLASVRPLYPPSGACPRTWRPRPLGGSAHPTRTCCARARPSSPSPAPAPPPRSPHTCPAPPSIRTLPTCPLCGAVPLDPSGRARYVPGAVPSLGSCNPPSPSLVSASSLLSQGSARCGHLPRVHANLNIHLNASHLATEPQRFFPSHPHLLQPWDIPTPLGDRKKDHTGDWHCVAPTMCRTFLLPHFTFQQPRNLLLPSYRWGKRWQKRTAGLQTQVALLQDPCPSYYGFEVAATQLTSSPVSPGSAYSSVLTSHLS